MKTRTIVLIVSGSIALASWGFLSLDKKQDNLAHLIAQDVVLHPNSWRQLKDTSGLVYSVDTIDKLSEKNNLRKQNHLMTLSVLSTMGNAAHYEIKRFRNDSLDLTIELTSFSNYYSDLRYARLVQPDTAIFTQDEYEVLQKALTTVDPMVRAAAAKQKAINTLDSSIKSVVAQKVFKTKIN